MPLLPESTWATAVPSTMTVVETGGLTTATAVTVTLAVTVITTATVIGATATLAVIIVTAIVSTGTAIAITVIETVIGAPHGALPLRLVASAATAAHPLAAALDRAPPVATTLLRLGAKLRTEEAGKHKMRQATIYLGILDALSLGASLDYSLFKAKQISNCSGFKSFFFNVGLESAEQYWFMSSPSMTPL